jgi:hypothetical protein
MKKSGITFNADKLKLWQCCGVYHASGVRHCSICGKSKPDNNHPERADAQPERRKQSSLDCKSAIAQALPRSAARYHITIERHSPRTLDDDNFCGGCKQLRDTIAELLGKTGDSEADGLTFEYKQVKSKLKKTVIKISELASDNKAL